MKHRLKVIRWGVTKAHKASQIAEWPPAAQSGETSYVGG